MVVTNLDPEFDPIAPICLPDLKPGRNSVHPMYEPTPRTERLVWSDAVRVRPSAVGKWENA